MRKANLASDEIMPKTILRNLEKALYRVIGPHRNLARELAELLNLSQESIYRRFRGETSFTLNEVWILRNKWDISVDELFGNNGKIVVQFSALYDQPFIVKSYLSTIYKNLLSLSKEESCTLYCLASDIPLFRFFGYSCLTQFKDFYWKNLVRSDASDKNELFQYYPEMKHPTSDAIHELYNSMEVHEIWSSDTLNGTLNQIEYYFDSGLMDGVESLKLLYQNLVDLVDDLVYGENHGSMTFHYYELALNNNSFYVNTKCSQLLAIGINGINSLQTRDLVVINDYKKWLNNVLSKSLKISGQSQKQKFTVLNTLKSKIFDSASGRLPETMLNELID